MIAIGCDHGGFTLKLELLAHLKKKGVAVLDVGTNTDQAVDYPPYAQQVAEAVLSGKCTHGVLLCGTGIGISIAANHITGVRCALCHDVFSATAARSHNDANILAMGGRVIGAGHATAVLEAFLETPFSQDPRHIRRIQMIDTAVSNTKNHL